MTYHQHVPRDLAGNLNYRQWILAKCRREPKYRKAVMLMCERDPIFWVNAFVMQFNPNTLGDQLRVGPFITWEFQAEAINTILEQIRERKDLCVEKSREMGASWIFLIVLVWMWLYKDRATFILMSRDADAVDDSSNPQSLFWKIDFILDHLPKWMKPVIESGKDRQKMKLINRRNHSTITGTASTKKGGVGGRVDAMFFDEFTIINDDVEVLQNTADTTRCRLFNFTHTGIHTAGYTLTKHAGIKKLQMHWSMHPEKRRGLYYYDEQAKQIVILDKEYEFPPDYEFVMTGKPDGPFAGLRSPWYDAECIRRNNSRYVAMHLDMDPEGSSVQYFESLDIKRLVMTCCRPPMWEGDLRFDLETAKPVELLRRSGGTLKLWFLPDHDGRPPKGIYSIGCDVSGGVGTTPSCMSIFNGKLGEKVGEYSDNRIYPDKFARLAVAACWLFKSPDGDGAQLIWEKQGPGGAFGKEVLEAGYRNVWLNRNETEMGGGRVSNTPGWNSNKETKRLMLEEYKSGLLSSLCVNRSEEALKQCLQYRYNGNGIEHGLASNKRDPAGSGDNHGDLVIADGLGWKIAKGLVEEVIAAKREESIPVGSFLWRRRMHEMSKADSYY